MELTLKLTLMFAAVTFAVSAVINKIFLRFTTNLGTRSTGEVRFASTSKPSVGGFSFYINFLLCFITINLLFPNFMISATRHTAGIFAATSLGFLLGFGDDAYNTNPVLKFAGQITCGLILVFADLYIPLFPNSFQGGFLLNTIFTVVWVVGIMNSLNMLDNMDGITSSVSICILACGLMILGQNSFSDIFTTLLIVGVISTLFGFLIFNWPDARMYMGDTGSQFLGVFLAAMAIKLFWTFKEPSLNALQIKQFIIPLLAFIMPIIDTTTVFIRRLARRQSPLIGGADHTTHHLAYLGVPIPVINLIFIVISLASLIWIHLLLNKIQWNYLQTYLVISYFLLLFLVMQFLYDLGGKKKQARDTAAAAQED